MIVADRGLIGAIESSFFVYPAVPGLSQDLGIAGLRGRVTRISHALLNLAGDARLSERDVDAVIARVRERYRPMAFGWITGPSTAPVDLPARLEAAGLDRGGPIAGMALTDLSIPIPVDPRVRVREVMFEEALGESEMMARAYGLTLKVSRFITELLAATADRVRSRSYFAYLEDDRPAAWSYLVYLPDSPIVLLGGAATLPEHRGRGLYRALVARRVADARADGRSAAVIQAGRMSAPICAKIGFQQLCVLEMFSSRAV